MASISDLYRQAERLRNDRIGWQARHPPSYPVMREIDDLKRIMDGLVNAYRQAGGVKVDEHEHVEGAPPYKLVLQ